MALHLVTQIANIDALVAHLGLVLRQIEVHQLVVQLAAGHVGPEVSLHVLLIDVQLVDRGALPLTRTTDTVLAEIHALTEARACLALAVLGAVAALDDNGVLGDW